MALAQLLNAAGSRLRRVFGRPPSKPPPPLPIREESLARYRPGGYHPVRIGDTFKDGQYVVVNKLGYGLYSTVWLAQNLQSKTHVALKILTADTFGRGKNTFELDILRSLRRWGSQAAALAPAATTPKASTHILHLLDEFEHRGPNGTHVCLVFKAMGPDMSYYRKMFPGASLPPALMREVSRQLLLAISHLHDDCQVIHTDIKPQNILVETAKTNDLFQHAPREALEPEFSPMDSPNDFYMLSTKMLLADETLENPSGFSVSLSDFGTSSWFDKHLTEWIQPDSLRAPEVMLGASWDHKADIWNLGTVIWELAQGSVLFDGAWEAKAQYTTEAHLAQMVAVFGPFPTGLLDRSSRAGKYFDSQGHLRQASKFPGCTLMQLCTNKEMGDRERDMFLEFIGSMLRLNPADRLEARVLLEAEWLRSDGGEVEQGQ